MGLPSFLQEKLLVIWGFKVHSKGLDLEPKLQVILVLKLEVPACKQIYATLLAP